MPGQTRPGGMRCDQAITPMRTLSRQMVCECCQLPLLLLMLLLLLVLLLVSLLLLQLLVSGGFAALPTSWLKHIIIFEINLLTTLWGMPAGTKRYIFLRLYLMDACVSTTVVRCIFHCVLIACTFRFLRPQKLFVDLSISISSSTKLICCTINFVFCCCFFLLLLLLLVFLMSAFCAECLEQKAAASIAFCGALIECIELLKLLAAARSPPLATINTSCG